jgi:biopolymer transport protein ExbD
MRAPSNLARGGLGFNMTPMIDVVFLLIIFFLVSSHLARQETQLELDLPDAASGEPTGEDDVRRVVVNVLPEVRPEGRIQVGGQRMHLGQLAGLIRFERGQAERENKGLQVRIRSDRQVPYGVIEPILLACAKAGVWNVTVAVREKRE